MISFIWLLTELLKVCVWVPRAAQMCSIKRVTLNESN